MIRKLRIPACLPAGKDYELRGGWTFVDIIIALGIFAALIGLATLNLNTVQHKAYSSTTLDTLFADMSLQQTRAMMGDASVGGTRTGYGIYFQSDKYILFKGNSYNAADAENLTVNLNSTVQFTSIGFPSSQVVFAAGSGAFSNYASGQDTVTILDSQSGRSQTLHINSYGVLDTVN